MWSEEEVKEQLKAYRRLVKENLKDKNYGLVYWYQAKVDALELILKEK